MSVFKKVTAALSTLIVALLVTLFCVVFTAPGNQLIAYSANKLVDGLKIEINNGRFLYNDAFNFRFERDGLLLDAQQLKLDLFWWHCDGMCIDNLSARSIKLNLPASSSNSPDTSNEPLEQISLPFNIALKRLAVSEFVLNHTSANVVVNNVEIAAKAQGADIQIKNVNIPSVLIALKEQSGENTASSTPITELPALPNIAFMSPLNIYLEQFNIAQFTVEQNAQQNVVNNIALQMKLIGSEINVASLSANYQQWQLNTALNAKLKGRLPINGDISLKGHGYDANIQIGGDLEKLNVDIKSSESFPFELAATANLKQPNYPFSVNGDVEQWIIETASKELKITDVKLTAQGNANDYQLSLFGNSQLGAYPTVNFNSQINGSLSEAHLKKLALKANESQATIQANIDWQNGVSANFSGALSSLKAQYLTDTLTSDISGQFKGAFVTSSNSWKLSMDDTQLSGLLNDVPLNFAAQFNLNDELKATVNKFNLSSGTNRLTLTGEVDQQWQINGAIALQSNDDAKLPFIANGKADLSIRGERLTPAVDLALKLEQFIYDEININKLALKAQLDTATDWQTDISVTLDSARVMHHLINKVEIAGSGDKTDHQLSASIDADAGAAAFELNGKFANAIWQGELNNISISDKTLSFENTKDIAVTIDSKTGDFDVSAHCWQSSNSKLCIDRLNQTRELGQLNVKLTKLSLQELKHWLPDNVITRGDIAGDFAANWQAGALKTLRANLNSSGLNAVLINEEDRFKLPIETLNISAFSDAKVGKIEANLESSVLGKVTTKVDIDDIQNKQTLNGNIQIDKILLSDIQPFLNTLEQLNGAIRGQVALAGTLKDPLLEGNLNIENINLVGEQLPVALKNSNINVVFNKSTATIKGDLNDPEGGQVKLTGNVDWQGEQPAVNMNLVGSEFFVRAQQGVVFKVSPELKISLADNALKLAGDVVVPYGRIEIEELPEGAVQVSDDEIILDQTTQSTKKAPFDYAIDLKVTVKNDVRVASFGLESKVVGDMDIKMSQDSPIIAIGELNLIEGTYLAFGQDLIIRTGQIGFSGAIDKPHLNIKAIRNPNNTADGVIAGVTLTGSVEQPNLKVFSEPGMDQAQALAYLLNGQPLGEGDSSTDAMLAQLLLSQGVSRSESLVSKVGESFGLSDVSLSSKGSGEQTKVEISGYLAPSLQVKYSVGVFESLSEVAVRYQLMSKLYIEITSGLYQNVDILYKFNWD